MKNLKNIIIISILLIVPILILYFNIYPLNLLDDSIKENYENNYINVCKSKLSNFYDINIKNSNNKKTYNLGSRYANNCKYKCSRNNCDLYTIKHLENNNVKCETYNLDSGNQLNSAKINCDNNKLSNSSSKLFNEYNGYGYINKDYYNNNKDKFKYIDHELNKTNSIISKYQSINNELNNLKGTYKPRDKLIQMYDEVNADIAKIANHLDLSKNMIYSNFVPNEYSVDINKDLTLGNNTLDYDNMMKFVNDVNSENKFLNAKENITKDTLQYKFSFYLALVIILIITAIILIIYKISDKISSTFIIGYFSFITLGLIILHYFFKI